MPEFIETRNILDQYKAEYTEYARYVEETRTTPSFKDGLKKVHRRILYAASFIVYNHSDVAKKKKSADIIGTTMGGYHPHGDSSIEGALYGMVTWWQTKYPLFNGQGNFGNRYENSPAAPRYTEVRVSDFADDVLISEMRSFKDIVDWEPTYDESRLEPVFLPSKVPLLLINGTTGIAVGEKIDIPNHNLGEVIDATIALIKNPKAKVVLIPDHCQKCEIVDTNWAEICNKGNGTYKVRGVIDVEDYKGNNKKYKGYTTLVIKSVPDLTFLGSIVSKITQMIKDNKIIGILDYEEQTTVDELRYVYVLKPGTDPEYVRNEIYRNTDMMKTARVNLKVVDPDDRENLVKRLSYKGYLNAWIEFRKITKVRYYEHQASKLMTRKHSVDMYMMAFTKGISDDIVNLIKKTNTTDDNVLIEALIKKFGITDMQARFFINCELKKLGKAYYNSFKAEQAELNNRIAEITNKVMTDGVIEQEIIAELLEIKKKYNTPRACKIIKESEVTGVATGMFKIIITEGGFIKKIGMEDYITKPKNDSIKFILCEDNSKSINLFNEFGRVFNIPVQNIPFADKNSNGVDIRLVNKNVCANITSAISSSVIEHYRGGYIVTLTKKGFIKRMKLDEFLNVPISGLVYCKLDVDGKTDDNVIDILLFNTNSEIVVYGNKKALRIDVKDITELKRNARGCVSMGGVNAEVEGMSAINKNSKQLVVVTKNGYVNKIIPDGITKGRAKAGKDVIKLGKYDNILTIIGVDIMDVLEVTLTTGEVVELKVSEMQGGTSISTGVKLIKGGEVYKVVKKVM